MLRNQLTKISVLWSQQAVAVDTIGNLGRTTKTVWLII